MVSSRESCIKLWDIKRDHPENPRLQDIGEISRESINIKTTRPTTAELSPAGSLQSALQLLREFAQGVWILRSTACSTSTMFTVEWRVLAATCRPRHHECNQIHIAFALCGASGL